MKRSKKMRRLTLLLLLTALLAIPAVADYVHLTDGGIYVINDTRYEDDFIRLDYDTVNTPGTSFTLLTGGIIGEDLRAYENSTAIINGGTVGGTVGAGGNSIVEIESGIIQGYVYAGGNGLVEINGGSISGKLSSKGEGTIKVTGGVIGGIFDVWHDGIIELYGSGFSVGGEDLSVGNSLRDYGTLELVGGDYFYTGTITGTLNDGSILNNYFQILEPTAADIIIIPEPCSLVLLGLGGLVLRRSRRVGKPDCHIIDSGDEIIFAIIKSRC